MPMHVFFDKKIEKEAFLGGSGGKEGGGFGSHIPVPETRTNFCSYAQRILKIGSKGKK